MKITLCSEKGCVPLAGRLKEGFLEEVALLRPLPKRWDLNQWKWHGVGGSEGGPA